VGRHLARLRLATSPATAARLEACLDDLRSAARVDGEVLEARDGVGDGAFELVAIELAEVPPEA